MTAAPRAHAPRSPLDPPLPFDMRPRAEQATRDVQLQQFVGSSTRLRDRGRVQACRAAFGERYDELRELAGRIKQHTLDHLDVYLERFIEQAGMGGATVHFAADAGEANAICVEIARRRGCRSCVKSKSMVTEEIGLVPVLESAGVRTVETDLGEFIIQLDGDAPSHIVAPMIHKNRQSVARAFVRELRSEYTEDPQRLTMIARRHLREVYRRADLGISGANFLVAGTGTVVICTNEGNADLSVSTPPVHIAVAGIEKLVPELGDLALFLKLLARSATAQPLTVYTTLITGPRRRHEHDGPEEVHIVLLDNGRTGLLAEETRELLRCIRCGACLNACPVYRSVGGHAYGAVYSGPIGAAITPLFKGLGNYADLPQASSLCGACFEACPVHIDIPAQLVRLRRLAVEQRIVGRLERLGLQALKTVLVRPWLYQLATRALRVGLRRGTTAGEAARDPHDDRRWVSRLGGPLAGWTERRDFPTPTSTSFREWWDRRERRKRT